MDPLFLNGRPALYLKKDRVLVAGDLHIGVELGMKEKGLFFNKAAEKMASSLLETCKLSGAKSVALLGDVKDSIGVPPREEVEALKEFFAQMHGIEVRIAKGNHDAYLERILKGMGANASVEKEILLGEAALMHGNAWPSDGAMEKQHIITGHGHIAAQVNGRTEKAWLVAGAGKMAAKIYERCNEGIKLVVAPAFNPLITGTRINERTRSFIPLFKGDVFDFNSAKVYALDGSVIGAAGRLAEEEKLERRNRD